MAETADPHWLRDSLVADAVATSEVKTGERLGRKAEEFIVPILERMDQKPKIKAKPKSTVDEDAQAQLRAEAARQGIAARFDRFVPEPTPDVAHQDSPVEAALRKRVQWMNARPEYQARMRSIFGLIKTHKISPQRGEALLWELVKKADAQEGRPWWKPKPKALHFG